MAVRRNKPWATTARARRNSSGTSAVVWVAAKTGALMDSEPDVINEGRAPSALARTQYVRYVCPGCGHEGNDADPHIHHTVVGIICLKCGAKICD